MDSLILIPSWIRHESMPSQHIHMHIHFKIYILKYCLHFGDCSYYKYAILVTAHSSLCQFTVGFPADLKAKTIYGYEKSSSLWQCTRGISRLYCFSSPLSVHFFQTGIVLLSLSKSHNLYIIKNKNESAPIISFHWLVMYLKRINESTLAYEMGVELTCEGFLSWKTRWRHQRKKLLPPPPLTGLNQRGGGAVQDPWKQCSCKLEMTSMKTRADTLSTAEQQESWVPFAHFAPEQMPATTYLWACFVGKFIYYLFKPEVGFYFTCKSMNSNLEFIFS